MNTIKLFSSYDCGDLLVEVVDIALVKVDGASELDGCLKRNAEKVAAQIAVNRMFNRHVKIKHADDGHPYIDGMDGSLSISHTRNILIAVYSSSCIVGVDVEYPREALNRVSSKFLSSRELTFTLSLDSRLRAWTIKEAVYKAMLHKGLSLYSILIPAPNEKPHAVVETGEGQVGFKLFYDKIGDAMVTIAVRDDAECRGTAPSSQPD